MADKLKEIVRYAPGLPERLPPRLRGRLKNVDAVSPHCDALYEGEGRWRDVVGSLDKTTSPNGRLAFDDYEAAKMVQERAKQHHDNNVERLTLAAISTAIKHWLNRFGFGRAKRIAHARELALNGPTMQPAE